MRGVVHGYLLNKKGTRMENNIHKSHNVPPFLRWCSANIPGVFDNSMSYYETLCALMHYLQHDVVETVNSNANTLRELYDFTHNYFDNLDVQEEINNKLDEMADDGTLQEIMAQYLNANAVWCFDSVEDMRNATNLIDGSFARTYGYYAKNDGGAAFYKIRNITNDDVVDGGSIIEMGDESNTLIAELNEKEITPEMFGAYGDGNHDDTQAFANAVNYAEKMILTPNKNYKINKLEIAKDFEIDGNGSILTQGETTETKFIKIDTLEGPVKHVKLNNFKINASCDYGVYVAYNKCSIKNVTIENPTTACIYILKGNTAGHLGWLEADNVECRLTGCGIDIHATDCFISNYHGYNCRTHINVASGLTHLNTVHGWNYNTGGVDWISGSKLVECHENSGIVGSDIYIDTLETGFNLPSGGQYTAFTLQNVNLFINKTSYPKTQTPPLAFRNVENYSGKLHVDGFHLDANGWTDNTNKSPIITQDFVPTRIKFTNVSQNGFDQIASVKVVPVRGEIATSEFSEQVSTYVSLNNRKYYADGHIIKCKFIGTMKTGCQTGNIMTQITFLSDMLKRLNRASNVRAVFYESTNPGFSYVLGATIDNNNVLTVYNNSGITLGGATHSGSLEIFIELDGRFTV